MSGSLALGPGSEPIPVRTLDVRHLPMVGDDPPVSSYQTLLAPQSLHLRLTNKCDAECNFCERVSQVAGDKDWEGEFTLEQWETIKAKGWLDAVTGIEVAGLGEPTLSKLFPIIARDVLAAGKTLYFPTNGHFLDTKLTDCLGDGTNVRVSVSMDAGMEATYMALGRGKAGEWEKTWAGIKAFKVKCPKAFLHSQYTASVQNIDEFPQFMERAAEAGIEEVILRFVQAHSVAREDVSLRFAKDRTEAALNAAWLIANEKGVTLHAERRPYSASNPNLPGDTATDATSRLKRYTDFVPMDATNCPPPCTTPTSQVTNITYTHSGTIAPGDTGIAVETSNTFHSVLEIICGTCKTNIQFDSYYLANSFISPPQAGFTDMLNMNQVIVCGYCTTATSTSHLITQSQANPPAPVVTVGEYHSSYSGPPNCSPTCGFAGSDAGGPIFEGEANPGNDGGGGSGTSVGNYNKVTTSCCATDAAGTPHCCDTVVINLTYNTPPAGHPSVTYSTIYSGDPGACPPTAMSEGTVQVIRSVKVPRTQAAGQFVAQSVDDAPMTKPVAYAAASLIVWANGELTSCFARHKVGDLDTDTPDSVILNPRYQAFLQNRQNGNVLGEGWCRDCPRAW